MPTEQVAKAVARVRTTNEEQVVAEALAIGNTLLGEGRFAEAVDLFLALADKRPGDPFTLYGAGLSSFNVGRMKEAEMFARRAVDAALSVDRSRQQKSDENEGAANALVLLAVVSAVKGDYELALKSARQAVALAPRRFDAQLTLGRALFGAGDDERAVEAFRSAVSLKPANMQALFFLATTLEHKGDTVGALAAYRQLIAQAPLAPEGHLGLGVLLLKMGSGEADEGMRELTRALEINPSLYEARVSLGRALIARGRLVEAVEDLRRAAELAPENPEPHYQLALAYRRLGRNDEAARETAIVERIHELRRGLVK